MKLSSCKHIVFSFDFNKRMNIIHHTQKQQKTHHQNILTTYDTLLHNYGNTSLVSKVLFF